MLGSQNMRSYAAVLLSVGKGMGRRDTMQKKLKSEKQMQIAAGLV